MLRWQHVRPLWRLLRVSTLPRQLLDAHLQGYALLARLELAREWALWRRRTLLAVLAAIGGLAMLVLAGVALMLWAVLPQAQMHAPWVLLAVPLAPGVLLLGCLLALRAPASAPPFAGVRRQWAADRAWLQGRGTDSGLHGDGAAT